ncbi:MAG TPA: hypothetical protein V6D10_02765 [Trichocoleus sp.]
MSKDRITVYSRDMVSWGQSGVKITDDMKLKIYPAVIGVMGVCLLTLLVSRIEIITPTPRRDELPVEPRLSPSPVVSPSPIASASPSPTPASPVPDQPSVSSPAPANLKGSLRVGNQTTYPVRVALLFQQKQAGKAAQTESYRQPVHWDFAPGEGGAKGLLVSLPDGNLQLQAGDILVAFAQDGSRRYWGPYIVGKTDSPTWDKATQEWELILN